MSRSLVLIALDSAALILASCIARSLVEPDLSIGPYAAVTGCGCLLTTAALAFCDGYRPSVTGSAQRTLAALMNAMALAFVAGLVLYYVVKVPEFVVPCTVRTATLYFPLILVERTIFRTFCNHPSFTRRVLILGTSSLGREIAKVLADQRGAGLELVGFLADPRGLEQTGDVFARSRVIGTTVHLEKILRATRVDQIVVATTERDDDFPAEVLQAAKMSGCSVESGVAFLERISGRIYLRDLHPGYLIFSQGFHTGRVGRATKRAMDIIVSVLGMIVILPVMVLCAVAIKLESQGPVLFRQVRLGRRDRPFVILKLRSMCEDAEAETGPVFAAQGDARVTKVGHFLRRTRIDEFPQLWNILRGEMTLVGPRAERPEFADSLNDRYAYYRLRSCVKPGLTGWAQTRFGYVSDVDAYEEKLALDFYYLKHRSTSMDLLILWQTVKTVCVARGV